MTIFANSQMAITIPERFFNVQYVSSRIPGCDYQADLGKGANCQVFAYELLRENGLHAPNLRSSNLWADEHYTKKVTAFQPLDILLYNKTPDAYGAHVAVYVGDGMVIHLSLDNGTPKIQSHASMIEDPKYAFFIGAKRIL